MQDEGNGNFGYTGLDEGRATQMKRMILGFLSIALILTSFWGMNSRSQRPRPRETPDTGLWV